VTVLFNPVQDLFIVSRGLGAWYVVATWFILCSNAMAHLG